MPNKAVILLLKEGIAIVLSFTQIDLCIVANIKAPALATHFRIRPDQGMGEYYIFQVRKSPNDRILNDRIADGSAFTNRTFGPMILLEISQPAAILTGGTMMVFSN